MNWACMAVLHEAAQTRNLLATSIYFEYCSLRLRAHSTYKSLFSSYIDDTSQLPLLQ
jgi:hypothetical protein